MGAGDKTGGTNMGKYLVKRILQMIPVMIIITMIIFILLNVAGDPTVNLLPLDATEAEREALRTAMGLNRPLPVQYLDFLKKAFTGDFGNSYRFNQPALQLAMARMPMSIQLAGAALLFAVVMAQLLGWYYADPAFGGQFPAVPGIGQRDAGPLGAAGPDAVHSKCGPDYPLDPVEHAFHYA